MQAGKKYFRWYPIALFGANILWIAYTILFVFYIAPRNGSSSHSNGFALIGFVAYGIPALNVLFILIGLIGVVLLKWRHPEVKPLRYMLQCLWMPIVALALSYVIIFSLSDVIF